MSVVVRSCLFAAVQILITPPFAIVALLTFPLPPFTRYRVITTWSRLIVAAAEKICGVRYRVIGAENLPQQPAVILAKHQSAWETLAFPILFPPQAMVVKRELLWIPFFGWGLAMLSPIAIDRSAGTRAARQMIEQGKERLAQGFWILVFPEGTRVAPGARGKYRVGGSAIAAQTGAPIVPVAHNAGCCWGRAAFLKHPGMVTVSIGPALDSRGARAEALTQQAENWIESEMQRLGRADGRAGLC
ncbi:MAG TPA: lysophospholipid acyltransferase family protein [Burkholderiales bacterium]|nr:lysophospholipid acyltransferase family protein [Burkholderiales bacterium]